jgi:deoxyribonuclease-1
MWRRAATLLLSLSAVACPGSAPREASKPSSTAALTATGASDRSDVSDATLTDEPRDTASVTPPPMPVDDETLYAGCPMRRGTIQWPLCCFVPENERRRRLEWEHVVPAAAFGRALPAWRDGDAKCRRKGKPFRGRRCARRASAAFRRMEGDMHNLFPSIGHLNGERGHRKMALIDGEARDFGRCDFEVDGDAIEPRPSARGEIARAYLYMNQRYPEARILDADGERMFRAWSSDDPPSAWERTRNQRIRAVQGNANPFIDR